jgi:pyruvate formate lyase activating enzyme
MKAMYSISDGSRARCLLCPHKCDLADGQKGFCGVRQNNNGELHAINAFRSTSIALDPIEKKPLYHFHPGSKILSAGSFGCNLACSFCQNSDISREFRLEDSFTLKTEDIIEKALLLKRSGNIGVAFTYNEPVVWYETVLEIAAACKKAGLVTVMVTNGYIEPGPLEELLPFIDAMNIDLKAFTDEFYRRITKGSLAPVLETIKTAAKKCHVEVTTLIIPGLNDSAGEMDQEAAFLAGICPELPLHITRFFPRYKMTDAVPTPFDTLRSLKEIASGYLHNVYIGNV